MTGVFLDQSSDFCSFVASLGISDPHNPRSVLEVLDALVDNKESRVLTGTEGRLAVQLIESLSVSQIDPLTVRGVRYHAMGTALLLMDSDELDSAQYYIEIAVAANNLCPESEKWKRKN